MRQTLASSLLSLVGTRVVYEDADSLEPYMDDVLLDCPSESLFDRLLCVLQALLGNSQPSWLKTKPSSKPDVKFLRDLSAIDKEVTKSLQVCLVFAYYCSLLLSAIIQACDFSLLGLMASLHYLLYCSVH